MATSKDTAPAPAPPSPVDWTGTRTQRVEYQPAATIFAQGDPATSVMYVDQGAVRLSVLFSRREGSGRRGTRTSRTSLARVAWPGNPSAWRRPPP